MHEPDVNQIMEALACEIAEAQRELDRKSSRRLEIGKYPNSPIKRKIITRYNTEIMHLTDELNAKRANLWALQEADRAEA